MKLAHVLIASLLIAFTQTVIASDWKVVSDGSKAKLSIDMESAQVEDPKIKSAWFKIEYSENKKGDFLTYRSLKTLVHVDCKRRTIKQERAIRYNADDEQVANQGSSDETFTPITPDTFGDTMHRQLCKTPGKAK